MKAPLRRVLRAKICASIVLANLNQSRPNVIEKPCYIKCIADEEALKYVAEKILRRGRQRENGRSVVEEF